MNKEERKLFKNNTIKLIIGLLLLWLSFNYLNNHPAEKVSVWSGFSVLWQKVEVWFHNVFTGKWEVLSQKYEYEKYLKELVKMAENKKCLSVDIVKTLNDTYTEIKLDSVSEFQQKLIKYKRYLDSTNTIITNWCQN